MEKMIFGFVAAAGAAFSALGPAGIDPTVASPARGIANPVRLAWKGNAPQSHCRVEVRWRRDYTGQPYLNKVRICA